MHSLFAHRCIHNVSSDMHQTDTANVCIWRSQYVQISSPRGFKSRRIKILHDLFISSTCAHGGIIWRRGRLRFAWNINSLAKYERSSGGTRPPFCTLEAEFFTVSPSERIIFRVPVDQYGLVNDMLPWKGIFPAVPCWRQTETIVPKQSQRFCGTFVSIENTKKYDWVMSYLLICRMFGEVYGKCGSIITFTSHKTYVGFIYLFYVLSRIYY